MPRLSSPAPRPPTSVPSIFGIRHHGPGSAYSLLRALETLQPDALVVEGPPEAEAVLPLLGHAEMRPPVALLIYAPSEPRRAVYDPFAVFSPEWQALQYGLKHNITIRFMDLPQSHQLAMRVSAEQQPESEATPLSTEPLPQPGGSSAPSSPPPRPDIRDDPLAWLARAAGYGDGERWWEQMVEQRQRGEDVFTAIFEAMTVLRHEAEATTDSEHDFRTTIESAREAYMRQTLRATQRDGFERIAVVCGAWHAPAITEMPDAQVDAARLKDLPRMKVEATWVPWTYGRLTFASGYGAGITSPGWYEYLWQARTRRYTPEQVAIHWLTRVARLLRKQDLEASSAQVIEAVRLAEALAALREHALPGLDELTEATQTVLCFGEAAPLQLIQSQLIVGETMGTVPGATPMVPLRRDLQSEQKRLRLSPEPPDRSLDLDLRKATDLERSNLLHRLNLLGLPWGQGEFVKGVRGTFHELWRLRWQPEFEIKLIEAGIWGNTLYDAVTACTRDAADHVVDLPPLTQLLVRALLANLPEVVSHLMARVQAEAALASDIAHLMNALPPFVNVLRYGNVRQTDSTLVNHIVGGLVARICIGLPLACASLNDAAASAMVTHINMVQGAMAILQDDEYTQAWRTTVMQLAGQQGLHGLIAGRACRLLLDADLLTSTEAAQHLSLALSPANEPAHAAAWIEGFLQGSGLPLLHDAELWQVIDEWVTGLSPENFTARLPLLRRTFSNFTRAERRQLGERAKNSRLVGGVASRMSATAQESNFDTARAERVLPLVAKLLGVELN